MPDTKISALPAVTVPAGADEFAVNQSGTSKKITLTQVTTATTVLDHGNAGATETIDPTVAGVHVLTLDADCTLTISAPATAGCFVELWIVQDGTGGRDITWPGSVTLQGTLDTTASTTSRVVLETVDTGATWLAVVAGGAEAAATAHIADTADAHDASAISVADVGGLYAATDVEAALAEIGAHPGDTSAAHAASAVSIADAGSYYTGTDVEAALQEIGAGGIGGGPASGHYEVIVAGSAPPVAVSNEAEDDWLYGWVED